MRDRTSRGWIKILMPFQLTKYSPPSGYAGAEVARYQTLGLSLPKVCHERTIESRNAESGTVKLT